MSIPSSPLPASIGYSSQTTLPYTAPPSTPIASPFKTPTSLPHESNSSKYRREETEIFFSSPTISPLKTPLTSFSSSSYCSPRKMYSEIKFDLPMNVIHGIMNNLREAYNEYTFNKFMFNALYDDVSKTTEWVYREGTLTSPSMYIGPGKVYVEDNLIPKKRGGEFSVSPVIEVSLTQNIPNNKMVIKTPLRRSYTKRSSFSPDSKLMKTIQGINPHLLRRFDAIVDVHEIKFYNKKIECGFYQRSEKDFSEINYAEASPLILYRLLDLAKAIQYLHDSGFVHNDLKENNFLFNGYDNVAKLTDFGSMKKIEENAEKDSTTATPFYADEAIWKDWKDQLESVGNQKNPASDVRSFAKFLIYGYVYKKLDAISSKSMNNTGMLGERFEERISILKGKIMPREADFILPKDRALLDDLDQSNPYRFIIFRESLHSNVVKTYVFPTIHDCGESIYEWIDLLGHMMDVADVSALRAITELACKMRANNSHQVMTMKDVVEALTLIAGDPENDVAGTPYLQKNNKRNASLKIEEDSPQRNRLKRESPDQLSIIDDQFLIDINEEFSDPRKKIKF